MLFGLSRPDPIGLPAGITANGTGCFTTPCGYRIVAGVTKHMKTICHEPFSGFQSSDRIRQQCFTISETLKFDPVCPGFPSARKISRPILATRTASAAAVAACCIGATGCTFPSR